MSFKKILFRDFKKSNKSQQKDSLPLSSSTSNATGDTSVVLASSSLSKTSSPQPHHIMDVHRNLEMKSHSNTDDKGIITEPDKHKETYVNMLYSAPIPGCSKNDYPESVATVNSVVVSEQTGNIESPEKLNGPPRTKLSTVKVQKKERGIFRLRPLNFIRTSSFKMRKASTSPPFSTVLESPGNENQTGEEKLVVLGCESSPSKKRKLNNNRLKRLFSFTTSSKNPVRKKQEQQQQQVKQRSNSMKNLKHVL